MAQGAQVSAEPGGRALGQHFSPGDAALRARRRRRPLVVVKPFGKQFGDAQGALLQRHLGEFD
jgi:hypothetical protein